MAGEDGVSRSVTIEDIAHELGVSKTTVSRAISGKGRVGAETRARVMDFIETHNFRPNAIAKALAKKQTFNLGFLLPDDSRIREPSFFQQCLIGACEEAAHHDYDTLLILDDSPEGLQMRRILDNQKVDGVIVARSDRQSAAVSFLKASGIPFVLIGSDGEHRFVEVDNNNRAACRDLTVLLLSRGLEHIALFCGERELPVSASRYEGFVDAFRQFGRDWDENLVFWDIDENPSALSKALDRAIPAGVECILCMDDMIALTTSLALRERGISIPGDIKLASCYDSAALESMSPSVTSLRFNARKLGKIACQELVKMVEGQQARSRTLPDYELLLRDSTN